MRFILRAVAILLLGAAGWVLAREAGPLLSGEGWQPVPLGQIWFDIDPASLNMLQAGVQRRISPGIWEDVIQPVLTWPAVPALGVLGLALLLAARRRGG